MHAYCDFDGTVSVQDATDYILSRLADHEWQDVERLWREGAIGSGECMQRQVSLIRSTFEELDKTLDEIIIDPLFPSFIDFCVAHSVPVTIVSDGVDYFIKRILRKSGLDHLPVIANRLVLNGRGGGWSWGLFFPYGDQQCATAAGVCKCRLLGGHAERIYVGDGRSDFCVCAKPELLFAKGLLAWHCSQQNVPFFPYRDFGEVISILSDAPEFRNRVVQTGRHAAA